MSAALAPTAQAHSTERFVLRLASAAAVGELQVWLTDAAPGDRAVYASGIDLPRDTDGVKLVSRWAAEGLVRPLQQRDPLDRRRTQFLIERLAPGSSVQSSNGRAGPPDHASGPSAKSPPGGRASYSDAAGRDGARAKSSHTRASKRAELLLGLLREAAAKGEACPGYGAVARRLGLGRDENGKMQARYLFHRLARTGDIALAREGGTRVVTILARGRAQGKRTASGSAAVGRRKPAGDPK